MSKRNTQLEVSRTTSGRYEVHGAYDEGRGGVVRRLLGHGPTEAAARQDAIDTLLDIAEHADNPPIARVGDDGIVVLAAPGLSGTQIMTLLPMGERRYLVTTEMTAEADVRLALQRHVNARNQIHALSPSGQINAELVSEYLQEEVADGRMSVKALADYAAQLALQPDHDARARLVDDMSAFMEERLEAEEGDVLALS